MRIFKVSIIGNIIKYIVGCDRIKSSLFPIPIDYKVTNTDDSKAIGDMLRRAKTVLRTNDFTTLYDKGYHTGAEFKRAYDLT